MVEHAVRDREVVGSSPIIPTDDSQACRLQGVFFSEIMIVMEEKIKSIDYNDKSFQPTPLTTPLEIHSKSSLFVKIFLAFGFLALFIFIAYFITKSHKPTKQSGISEYASDPIPTSIKPLQLTPTPRLSNGDAYSTESAMLNPASVTYLRLSNQNLSQIPPTISTLQNVQYIDLSFNALSTLPQELSQLKSLKEIILVKNKFSKYEQSSIKLMLPNTRVAFVPQSDFNPYFASNWNTYTNNQYRFSFRYHPDLLILEDNMNVSLKNDLANLNQGFQVPDAYINLSISIMPNTKNLSLVSILEENFRVKITSNGDEYVTDADPHMPIQIKKYKNGDIDGLVSDGGETEDPRVFALHNNHIYLFHFLPGGQTGGKLSDVAKATLDQSLATFKFLD